MGREPNRDNRLYGMLRREDHTSGGRTFRRSSDQGSRNLGEQPLTNETTYTFQTVGVTLASFDNLFEAAMFDLNTPSMRVATVSPYRGDFLNGITAADNPDSVKKKLGLCPVASENCGSDLKYIPETYEIPPLILVFNFNAGSKQMSS